MMTTTSMKRTKISGAVKHSIFLATTLSVVPALAFADTTTPAPSSDTAALSALLNHDDLTYGGVTLYGTVDIGFAHQTHGTPLSDSMQTGLEYLIQKNSNKTINTIAPNGMSQSKVGLKGDIKITDDLSAVFKLETGFDPTSGMYSDGLKSLTNNNGIALNAQTSNGDSSRAGQFFEGAAYAGVSSKEWGTFTFGRQNGLLTDGINKYDPQGGSYAFSVIGFSGVTAGAGDTEDARLDSSIRYSNQFGPGRVAMLYQFSNGSDGKAYELNLGTDFDVWAPQYGKLSLDAFYTHKNDAVSAAALSAAQVTTLPTGSLAATISDNTAYTFMAKYSLNPINLYAGYEHIRYTNPSNPFSAGITDIGGYELSVINNAAYNNAKVLGVSWFGAKYAITPKLDLTGAYYHYNQNSYKGNSCSDTSAATCSGSLNAVSASLDYKVTKRFDIYGGVMSSKVEHGLASGYLHTSTADPMVGMRYNF